MLISIDYCTLWVYWVIWINVGIMYFWLNTGGVSSDGVGNNGTIYVAGEGCIEYKNQYFWVRSSFIWLYMEVWEPITYGTNKYSAKIMRQ